MDSGVPMDARPGPQFAAWGFRFFECDHDLDIVRQLNHETGISSLNDSLLNPGNPSLVVQRLTSGGALQATFRVLMAELGEYHVSDNISECRKKNGTLDSPRYYIFLLGLLAMQLGCTIPVELRDWMKQNWNTCLFMYERRDQAKMAAFEYVDGKPLHLGSKTLNQTIMSRTQESSTHDGSRNITVANLSEYLATMRIHMDNRAAQALGGSTIKPANIAHAFADKAGVPALEVAAVQKRKNKEHVYGAPPINFPELPKDAEKTSIACGEGVFDRLAEHAKEGEGTTKEVSLEQMREYLKESPEEQREQIEDASGRRS